MQMQQAFVRLMAIGLALLMAVPPQALGQESSTEPTFRQEELDQILAPIALYPDALLAQIFMASTYPLEIVQADRWLKQHTQLQGDALTAALEQQSWDPSVKSLVNFPQVLTMMSQKLDWTTKLGDAFLAQQEDIMNTVQRLRAKAQAEGNLKTNQEQKVIVEQQVIRIESPNPQVIYVPTYNPTVVYGPWWYPAYPPFYYHPPGYVAGAALVSFGVGVAIGAAWGYAWGRCNWRGRNINVNINRNINVNRNINRNRYRADLQRRGRIGPDGRGTWQHNAAHRKGVAYRDRTTAQRFNRATPNDVARSRQNFRGRAEAGRRDLARDRTAPSRDRQLGSRGQGKTGDRAGALQGRQGAGRSGTAERRPQAKTGSRGGAFQGVERGRTANAYSHRGQSSRSSMQTSRSGRAGGGFRGGGRRR
jgi:hypothetical protein